MLGYFICRYDGNIVAIIEVFFAKIASFEHENAGNIIHGDIFIFKLRVHAKLIDDQGSH